VSAISEFITRQFKKWTDSGNGLTGDGVHLWNPDLGKRHKAGRASQRPGGPYRSLGCKHQLTLWTNVADIFNLTINAEYAE
jgi:hypothetical protein